MFLKAKAYHDYFPLSDQVWETKCAAEEWHLLADRHPSKIRFINKIEKKKKKEKKGKSEFTLFTKQLSLASRRIGGSCFS